MDKQFKKVLSKLFSYSSVGKVNTITTPHIAFFNEKDEVVMVYNKKTQTMFINVDYIIALRNILGLDTIKPHNDDIQNYLVVKFPTIVINRWYSNFDLDNDISIR